LLENKLTPDASTPHAGFHSHLPGTLTHGAVLDVGLKCTHSCRFCYYSYLDGSNDQFQGMRRANFRSTDECKKILLGLKQNGFKNFDYTGGEPSLHPSIVELTHYAHKELGLRGRMITLGQFLMRKLPSCQKGILIEELLEAGLTNFLFSLHAVEEDLFKRITNESWSRLREAMNYLDERNFQYTSNTTVFDWNYKHLPEIAAEVLRHKIYTHNFIIMNAYYEWNHAGKAFGVQAKYSDIFPYLKEATDMLESNGVGVNYRYAPMCTVKGYEKNLVGGVGVRYDPYEWMNKAGHMGGSPEFCASVLDMHSSGVDTDWIYRESGLGHEPFARRGNVKVFTSKCASCEARSACDGVDPNYLKLYGDDELKPYTNRALYGPVSEPRREYLPVFQVKMEQNADMKEAMRAAFAGELVAPPPTEKVAVVARGKLPVKNLDAQKTHVAELADAEFAIVLDESVKEIADTLLTSVPEEFRNNPGTSILYFDAYVEEGGTLRYERAGDWGAREVLRKDVLPAVIAFDLRGLNEKARRAIAQARGPLFTMLIAAVGANAPVRYEERPLVVLKAPGLRQALTPAAVVSDASIVLSHPKLYSRSSYVWAVAMKLISLLPFAEKIIAKIDPRAGYRIPQSVGQGKLNLILPRGLRSAHAS
jgi:MoaA/NifB/PqqE/SkfB family radical SAM enzyme